MERGLSFFHLVWEMGFVGKIIIILLFIMSILSWAMFLKKKKRFEILKRENENFLKVFKSGRNLKEIYDKSQETPNSPFKKIFVNGYLELSKLRSSLDNSTSINSDIKAHFEKFGFTLLERSMHKAVNDANNILSQYNSVLLSIGPIAPFIGLFGTVWGIMSAFSGLTSQTSTLEAVAPGVSEALITTAVGLLVAIPAVIFNNYFSQLQQEMNNEMENFGQDFLNIVERSLTKKDVN